MQDNKCADTQHRQQATLLWSLSFHVCVTESNWHISATNDKGSILKDKSITLLWLKPQSFAIDLYLNTEGKNMADVLKAIIFHSCWHRCKDKLHWCFSCCVILIPGRTSVGWHSSTFLGTTCQGTSEGIWLLEQHRELHTQHTPMEVFVFSPAICQVLLGAHQAAGICRQSFSCDS